MTDLSIPESWKPLIEAAQETTDNAMSELLKSNTLFNSNKIYSIFLTAFLNEAVKAGLAKRATAWPDCFKTPQPWHADSDVVLFDEGDFPALILKLGDKYAK